MDTLQTGTFESIQCCEKVEDIIYRYDDQALWRCILWKRRYKLIPGDIWEELFECSKFIRRILYLEVLWTMKNGDWVSRDLIWTNVYKEYFQTSFASWAIL